MLLLASTTLSKLQYNTGCCNVKFSERAQNFPITYINSGGPISDGGHLWIGLSGIVNGVIFDDAIIEWRCKNHRRDVKGEVGDLMNSVCAAIKQHIAQNCKSGGFYFATDLNVDEFIVNITATWDHKEGQVCKLEK